MSYSLSFDVSTKMKSTSETKKLVHHTCRDVDARAGIWHEHANEMIDASRTTQNQTMVYNRAARKHERCTSVEQVADALSARLGDVTGRHVKNPVVMRGVVLQLDPSWYDGKSKQECRRAANDMMAWAIKTFGAENIIYSSRHRDESNEHLHLGICPVTADGRLSQKDWFGTPAKLRALHDDFRKHMIDAGYDIELERKQPGKHSRRLAEAEYKRQAELDRREAALEARSEALAEAEANAASLARQALDALKMAEREVRAARRDTQDLDAAAEALTGYASAMGLSL